MARKHISMEKALSVCINHSQALVDAVNRYNVHHRVDSEFRSIPKFSKAVGLVRGNRIGRIKKVVVGVPAPLSGSAPEPQPTMKVPEELDYDMWLGPAFPAPYTAKRVHESQNYNVRPGWMRIDDYCNGMITNWGAHLIDIALWGMDKELESPISVEGTGEFTHSLWNTIEAFNLTYQFKDGTTLEYLIDNPYVQFIGENDDWIKVPYGDKPVEASNDSLPEEKVDEPYRDVPSDKEDFINSIMENRPSMEPLEVGHNVYRLTNMGMIAAKLGRKLQWDQKNNDFIDDNAASSMLYRSVREKYLNREVADWMKQYGFS
jgi:predicted dehydrogenase